MTVSLVKFLKKQKCLIQTKKLGKARNFLKIINKAIKTKLVNYLAVKKFDILLHKKWSFPFKISSVNVTKSAVSCVLVHIYGRSP